MPTPTSPPPQHFPSEWDACANPSIERRGCPCTTSTEAGHWMPTINGTESPPPPHVRMALAPIPPAPLRRGHPRVPGECADPRSSRPHPAALGPRPSASLWTAAHTGTRETEMERERERGMRGPKRTPTAMPSATPAGPLGRSSSPQSRTPPSNCLPTARSTVGNLLYYHS